MVTMYPLYLLQNNKMSSKTNKCVMVRSSAITTPLKSPHLLASNICFLSPSTTKKNWIGDRGKYWRKPLSMWKKSNGKPLMRTAKETIVMLLITKSIKGTSNLMWMIISIKDNYMSLSYAFDKSILITSPFSILSLILWRPPWETTIAS